MFFLLPTHYTGFCDWWAESFGTSHYADAALAVLLMWLNTELCYFLVNALFIAVEKSGRFEKYKIQEEESNWDMVWAAIRFKPIVWMMDVPIYYISFCLLNTVVATSPHDPLPTLPRLVFEVIANCVVFDFLFYCWHRFLHTEMMLPYHLTHHEVTVCFACANDHEDVLELGGNILWKMVASVTVRSHVYTVCVFRAVVKFFALLHHCGYELPAFKPLQYIPGLASPTYHEFHHLHGYGNYGGVFSIWDHMFGTEAEYMQKKRAAGKKAA